MRQRLYVLNWSSVAVLLLMTLAVCVTAQTVPAQKQNDSGAPPVWTPAYNAEQGPLPDTSGWKVIRQQKNFIVRLAPSSDWSRYREVAAGQVRYTGSEIKLTPRQIAEVTDYLQKRLTKDLKGLSLTPSPGASGMLRVNANITDAKVSNRMVNMATVFASTMPGPREPASVTAWVIDSATQKPVACIETSGGEANLEWFLGFRQTGEIRMALRAQSRTLAWVLHQMGATVAAEEAKSPAR